MTHRIVVDTLATTHIEAIKRNLVLAERTSKQSRRRTSALTRKRPRPKKARFEDPLYVWKTKRLHQDAYKLFSHNMQCGLKHLMKNHTLFDFAEFSCLRVSKEELEGYLDPGKKSSWLCLWILYSMNRDLLITSNNIDHYSCNDLLIPVNQHIADPTIPTINNPNLILYKEFPSLPLGPVYVLPCLDMHKEGPSTNSGHDVWVWVHPHFLGLEHLPVVSSIHMYETSSVLVLCEAMKRVVEGRKDGELSRVVEGSKVLRGRKKGKEFRPNVLKDRLNKKEIVSVWTNAGQRVLVCKVGHMFRVLFMGVSKNKKSPFRDATTNNTLPTFSNLLWMSLILTRSEASSTSLPIGEADRASISLSSCRLHFPQDYPDTPGGRVFWEGRHCDQVTLQLALPKGKQTVNPFQSILSQLDGLVDKKGGNSDQGDMTKECSSDQGDVTKECSSDQGDKTIQEGDNLHATTLVVVRNLTYLHGLCSQDHQAEPNTFVCIRWNLPRRRASRVVGIPKVYIERRNVYIFQSCYCFPEFTYMLMYSFEYNHPHPHFY